MATNKQLKFFKGANAPAVPVAGMIWFCTTDRTIRVYTGSEWEKYSGLVNAEWVAVDKKLNITSANGTVTTLDLSDCASASDITTKLTTINNTLTSHDGRITAAQNAADAAAQAASVADGKAVQEAADRAAEITRVEGLITAEETRAKGEEAKNDKAASDAAALGQKGIDDAALAAAAVETEKGRAEGVEKGLDDRLKLVEGAIGDGGSVADAIKNAIEALNTPEAGVKGDGTHVDVTVKQVDGVITEVVVDENDIASAQALADEIANRAADEQAIGLRIDALDAAGDAEGNGKGRVTILEEQVRALNAATHFEGKVEGDTFDAAIAASGKTFESGDIVIYGNKEYIFDGTNWIELGDTTAEQNRLTSLENLVGTTSVDAQIDAKIAALSDEAKSSEDANLVKVTVSQADGNVTGVSVDDAALDAKFKATDDAVALNTAAVADYKTRIEALESTKNALDSTYVKVSDYSTDKAAFEQKHTDLQGEIDAAEGRLDVVEDDITTIKGEQTTQNSAIEAAAAKGQQGIDDAAAALAEAQAKVATVTAGDHISVGNDAKNPVVSVNVIGQIAEGNTGLVNGGAIFNELCWVEFE